MMSALSWFHTMAIVIDRTITPMSPNWNDNKNECWNKYVFNSLLLSCAWSGRGVNMYQTHRRLRSNTSYLFWSSLQRENNLWILLWNDDQDRQLILVHKRLWSNYAGIWQKYAIINTYLHIQRIHTWHRLCVGYGRCVGNNDLHNVSFCDSFHGDRLYSYPNVPKLKWQLMWKL